MEADPTARTGLHRAVILALILALSLFSSVAAQSGSGPTPEERSIRADFRFLSATTLEDRNVGSTGAAVAAEYMSAQFQKAGLDPYWSDGSYLRLTAVRRTRSTGMVVVGFGPETQLLRPETEIHVLGRAGRVTADGELVFVGYGIVAPDLGWDDIGSTSLSGRIALVLDGDPGIHGAEGFRADTQTVDGLPATKLETLARLGLSGVIFVHDEDSPLDLPTRVLLEPTASGASALPTGIQFVAWIGERMVDSVLTAGGRSLAVMARRAQTTGFTPIPVGAHVVADLDTRFELIEAPTVTGILPGSGIAATQVIVVTAHYDEQTLGYGRPHNTGALAALLSTARRLAATAGPGGHPVVFVATPGGHTAKPSALDGKRPRAAVVLDYLDRNIASRATLWGAVEPGVGVRRMLGDWADSAVGAPHLAPRLALSLAPNHVASTTLGIPSVVITSGGLRLTRGSVDLAVTSALEAADLAVTLVGALRRSVQRP